MDGYQGLSDLQNDSCHLGIILGLWDHVNASRGTPRVPAPLPQSPFSPPDRDRRGDSPAWSGRPKYWSFSFNISPSNEHPGLISFRMDWLALLAVQGTLKSPGTPSRPRRGIATSTGLPLGLALGSPIFPSGCEGKLGVALESLQGLRDLT